MKKYLILILFIPILLTGCMKKTTKNDDGESDKAKIISSIGKTNDEQIIVKYEANDVINYYKYIIKDNTFTLYCYIFYNDKDTYASAVKKYLEVSYYELESDDNALMTKIVLEKGSGDNSKDIRKKIMDKYKNNDEYEIIK